MVSGVSLILVSGVSLIVGVILVSGVSLILVSGVSFYSRSDSGLRSEFLF